MNVRWACPAALVLGIWFAGARVSATLTIDCQPIGGPVVSGGQEVAVECLLRTNVPQGLYYYQVDFACVLPALAAASGSVAVVSITADPDGDGDLGPGSHGELQAIGGYFLVNDAQCVIGVQYTGAAPNIISPTFPRYVATAIYAVDDCAVGEFLIVLENYSTPPSVADLTIFVDGLNQPIPLQFSPATLVVPAGTCCAGAMCQADDINEFCCEQTYPGARWFEGRTCDDPVSCPECLSDAECDDGLFCNGAESCNSSTGQCESGAPPTCDDGVACTVDSCNSFTDACEHAADHPLCDDSLFCNGQETCDPQSGCVAGEEPCGDGLDCDEATDTCFVPPIPTVSQWGLILLGLALLTGAKLRSFRYRPIP